MSCYQSRSLADVIFLITHALSNVSIRVLSPGQRVEIVRHEFELLQQVSCLLPEVRDMETSNLTLMNGINQSRLSARNEAVSLELRHVAGEW